MLEILLQCLQWVLPSGGVGIAIGWVLNRRVNQARQSKEVHDTYKKMYDDVSRSLLSLQRKNDECNEQLQELKEENGRTRRALNRLSRAIEAIQLCPYRSECPVRNELSIDPEPDGNGRGAPGQPGDAAAAGAASGGAGRSSRRGHAERVAQSERDRASSRRRPIQRRERTGSGEPGASAGRPSEADRSEPEALGSDDDHDTEL